MLALIIIANPHPSSLSQAMVDTAERILAARDYCIARHGLYAEHFDPIQPVGESNIVTSSDRFSSSIASNWRAQI